jgi:hypothetical protein
VTASSTSAPPAYPSRCEGTHEWTLAIDADGLGAYEGRRVWLSGVDRVHGDGIVVLVEGRVVNGRVALSCQKGFSTSYQYPTWALVIDADGSGTCSKDDRAFSQQLYGWNSDIVHSEHDAPNLVAQEHTVVGDHASFDFCALYFPAPAK